MLGRNKDMVELRLRMPGEGWKELTALLAVMMRSGVQENTLAEQEINNSAFDESVFRALAARSIQRNTGESEAPDTGNDGEDSEGKGQFVPSLSATVFERETGEDRVVPSRRADIHLEKPFSAPAPVDYIDGVVHNSKRDDISAETEKRNGETVDVATWERRWERDCRRYDSGFPLR